MLILSPLIERCDVRDIDTIKHGWEYTGVERPEIMRNSGYRREGNARHKCCKLCI